MILFLLDHTAQSQERKGFEEYYFPSGASLMESLSSKIFVQGRKNWYAEFRYNYEEEQTLGCSVGKTFFKDNAFSWSFTPVAGLVAGKLQGVSIGLNTSLSYQSISFSSSVQYSSCLEKKRDNYLFSWSELDCQITKHLYAGVSVQQTCDYPTGNQWEPGLQVGISYKEWTLPFYVFNPAGNRRFFSIGLCREWKKQN